MENQYKIDKKCLFFTVNTKRICYNSDMQVQESSDIKTTDGLLFKFAVIFTVFAIVSLLFSGIRTYMTQMKSYKAQCLENVRNIGDYLERLIQDAGEDFVNYQNYYMEHFSEVLIPYDFDEYHTALTNFQKTLNTSAIDD